MHKLIHIVALLGLIVGLFFFSPARPALASGSIVVNSTADNTTAGDGHCTLREAINNANGNSDTTSGDCVAGSGTDTIMFDSSLSGGTITLGSSLPDLSDSVTIDGHALASPITISGANTYRVFNIPSATNVTLDSLIIANGLDSAQGGGVNNAGTLTVNNSTFLNNHVTNINQISYGGAIYNGDGALTVTNSTFSGNVTTVTSSSFIGDAVGGAIYNLGGTLTVANSTFSGNRVSASTSADNADAQAQGGGIYNSGGTTTITNSTFSGNQAAATVTGSNSTASALGGGFFGGSGTVTTSLFNTIIANSTNGDCFTESALASEKNNLINDSGNACGLTNGVNGNIVGSDPKLGSLANNGGPTQTMKLLVSSPAIDKGNDTICGAVPVSHLDQRGVHRPQGAHCDIGAYEAEPKPLLISPANATTLLTRRPTFSWSSVNKATGYNIQISKVHNFSTVLNSGTVKTTSYTPSATLPANTLLDWRVRAEFGLTLGAWSDIWSFTTGNPPSTPALLSPANGTLERIYSPGPLLDWSDSTAGGAAFDHYEVQVATNSAFTSPLDYTTTTSDIADSQKTVTDLLTSSTKYYWRVQAWDVASGFSNWSAVRTFRTVISTPTLTSPMDNATNVSRKPNFTWSDTDTVTKYEIQVTEYTGFCNWSTSLIQATPTTAGFTPGTNLPANTTFCWWVKALSPNGPSDWSATRQFTTMP